jgi:transcriptional regulator with XRE-family HTH domain
MAWTDCPIHENVNGMKKRVIKPMPNFLKAWREYRKLTQDQLAGAADVSPPQISKIETGEAKFSHDSLYLLSRALSCSAADLLGRDPTRQLDLALWEMVNALSDDQKRQLIAIVEAIKSHPKVA